MTCVLHDGVLHIFSPLDFWRIAVNRELGKPVLYHRSRYSRPLYDEASQIQHYHVQSTRASDIPHLLRQIAEHDRHAADRDAAYLSEKPKQDGSSMPDRQSRNGRKGAREESRKQKKIRIARTIALIDELQALH